jgi:predicted Zn-dependent protease with MMP-like domain
MAVEMSRKEFDQRVAQAIARLPESFRRAVEQDVRVEVVARPTPDQLESVGLDETELLLGLYDGIPLPDRHVDDAPHPPDVIYLFYEDHLNAFDELEELQRELEVTLLHELGHYFGYDEEELDELGYG